MLLALLPQVLARNTQTFGRSLDVAASGLESEPDVFPLCLDQGESRIQSEAIRIRSRVRGPGSRLTQLGQVGATEPGPLTENQRSLHHVAQLAHVTGPVPCLQLIECLVIYRFDFLLELEVEHLPIVVGQQGEVAEDLAE